MDYDFSNFVLPESLSNTGISLNASSLANIAQMSTSSSLKAVQAASQALQASATTNLNSSSKIISELSEVLSSFSQIAHDFTDSTSKDHIFSENDHAILDKSFGKIIDFPDTVDLKAGKNTIRIKMSYFFQIIGLILTILSFLISMLQNLPQHQEPCPCLQERSEEEHSQSSNSDNLPHVVQSPSNNNSVDDESASEK
mgnify:CR=1 FL=1